MKTLKIIIVLTLITFVFFCCQKKFNKTFHLKGQLIDWYNNNPGGGTFDVGTQPAGTTKQDYKFIKSFSVNGDGSFDQEINASRSKFYYIRYTSGPPQLNQSSSGLYKDVKIENDETYDFGLVELDHVFHCKVNLKYTSNRDVTIHFGSSSNPAYHPYTNIEFYDQVAMSKKEFEENNHTYNLFYFVQGASIAEYSNVAIPIGQSDTVYADVNF
jgi:hypothetical protein